MRVPAPTRLLPNTQALPVWPASGIRALESWLQAASNTPLMTLAGLASAQLALALAPHARHFEVLAGPGNNGGDGLQAAAFLQRWGHNAHVRLLCDAQRLPADARRALQQAQQAGVTIHTDLSASAPRLSAQDLCIDALLGIGATRAPSGRLLQAVAQINASAAPVLALDIPTGLNADSGQAWGQASEVVQAQHTLTLIGAKPGLFMGMGRDVCGTLWLAPLSASVWHSGSPVAQAELNPAQPAPQRKHASHKGSHGDVAVVGGEALGVRGMGMTGAAILAAQAALHAGAGRVMLCLLQAPEAHTTPLAPDLMQRRFAALDLAGLTVVAGCGGGQSIAPHLPDLLQRSAALVLDADALNALAQDTALHKLLRQRPSNAQVSVLTPHPLEAARLLGCSTAQVQADRLAAAQQLSAQFGCVVVLKGSGTVVAAPGQRPRINTSGNGRLATGGTGDVLAGLLGARVAAGLASAGQTSPQAVWQLVWQAACQAVWQHGQMADAWPQDQALSASRLAHRLV